MPLYDNIKPNIPEPPKPLFSQFGYTYSDLYPNSPQDSRLWLELFIIVDKINPDLAKRLEYIRTTGARLIMDRQWGFIIQPIIDPSGISGWSSEFEYQQEKSQYLNFYSNEIIAGLSELRKRFDKGVIRG